MVNFLHSSLHELFRASFWAKADSFVTSHEENYKIQIQILRELDWMQEKTWRVYMNASKNVSSMID